MDDNYSLHWKSAPSQLPRYMDGYSVLVSTTDNFLTSFTDTLFRAASMETIAIGDGQSVDYSNFTFTPGYLHADGATLTDYFVPGTNLHSGLLEPHSVDLSNYNGQRIYIAFVHDSDDDDRLALDDILVSKAQSSANNDLSVQNFKLVLYPNPVAHNMTVNYQLQKTEDIILDILDNKGSLVESIKLENQAAGHHSTKVGLTNLVSGAYQLKLSTRESNVLQSFVKQ